MKIITVETSDAVSLGTIQKAIAELAVKEGCKVVTDHDQHRLYYRLEHVYQACEEEQGEEETPEQAAERRQEYLDMKREMARDKILGDLELLQ